jgi:CHAT domain-containing protein
MGPDRHYTFDEARRALGEDPEELFAHLERCLDCRGEVLRAAVSPVDGRVEALPSTGWNDDCMEDEAIARIAYGGAGLSPEQSHHVAHCARCRLRLVVAGESEIEATMVSLDEAEVMKAAARLRAAASLRNVGESSPRWGTLPWFWPAAAVVIVGLILLTWLAPWQTRSSLEAMLAGAYSADRSFEMRIPGAAAAPLHELRGGPPDLLRRDLKLLEAIALIRKGLVATPNNPSLLREFGTAELLSGNAEAAVNLLEPLHRRDPSSANLSNLLAIGYFERSKLTNNSDLMMAHQLLSEASRTSTDPVILFNYALVLHTLHEYGNECAVWQKYMDTEKDPGWRREAQSYIANCRAKQSLLRFGTREAVSEEDQIERALRDPFSAETFLRTVRSEDRWISDFRSQARRLTSYVLALQALEDAHRLNQNGDPASALSRSTRAAQLLPAVRYSAGYSWAVYEQVYANHRLARATECLKSASRLRPLLRQYDYVWLIIQIKLETSICTSMLGRHAQSQAMLAEAEQQAAEFGDTYLRLRAKGLVADEESASGKLNSAARDDLSGLALLWSDPAPAPARAFQFYSDLGIIAENRGLWSAALDDARESLQAIHLTGNRIAEASTRTQVAKCALAIGLADEAEQQLVRSGMLLESMPEGVAAPYRADDAIWLAQMDLDRGRSAEALARLESTPISSITDDPLLLYRLHAAKGSAALDVGTFAVASRELELARGMLMHTLEHSLLPNDRMYWLQSAAGVYRDLVQYALQVQHDPAAALLTWQEFRSLGWTGKSQTQVAPGTFAIVTTRSRVALLFADRSGTVHGAWSPLSKAVLSEFIACFMREVSEPGSPREGLHKDANSLYRSIFAPVLSQGPNPDVILFEPDTSLPLFPPQALVDERGKFLVERYRWRIIAGAARASSAEQPVRPDSRIVMVTSNTGSLQQPLEHLDEEIAAIHRYWPDALVLPEKIAAVNKLAEVLKPGDILHLLGHSSSIEEYGTEEGPERALRFGVHDRFDAAHAQLLLTHLRLAVLSSCSTATGGLWADNNLVSALLRNVPTVVASDWDVDSAASASLMGTFYAGLRHGLAPSEALQQAQIELAAAPAFAHPAYWAAFSDFASS